MNPAYIGKRVFRGEIFGDGIWPPLVDEETYWACVRLLSDPSRTTTRPARAVHLLSYIVHCGICGGPLSKYRVNRHGWTGQVYSCLKRRCVAVKAEYLDEYTQRAVVAWLSRPDVYGLLESQTYGDEEAARARAEASRLRTELEAYRKLAEVGDIKSHEYARFACGLKAQIEMYDRQATAAGIPRLLRERIGPAARVRWADLEDDLAVKREIIRLVAEIRLLPAGKGSREPLGRHRLDWRWKFCPGPAAV